MRRWLAGAALAFTTALVPLCVQADEPAATATYAVPATIALPHFEHATPPRTVPARAILYALQAYDAVQTAVALRHSGRFEMNPSVRPFTHGGALGIAFGFALGDLVRDQLLRHTSESVRESANQLQALANLDGILTTQQTMRAP